MSIYRTDGPLILLFCFCHRKRGMDSGNVKKLLIFALAVCLFCEYRISYSPFETPKKKKKKKKKMATPDRLIFCSFKLELLYTYSYDLLGAYPK